MTDVPIPMYLTCPNCGTRHVDEGEFATKGHHTHSCQCCGLTWRPAVGPTVGVAFLPGFKNEGMTLEEAMVVLNDSNRWGSPTRSTLPTQTAHGWAITVWPSRGTTATGSNTKIVYGTTLAEVLLAAATAIVGT